MSISNTPTASAHKLPGKAMSKTKARMTSAAPARITAVSEATGRRRGGHTNRADHRHHSGRRRSQLVGFTGKQHRKVRLEGQKGCEDQRLYKDSDPQCPVLG